MAQTKFFLFSFIILIFLGTSSAENNLKTLLIKEEAKEKEKTKITSKNLEYVKISSKVMKFYMDNKNFALVDSREMSISVQGYISNSIILPVSMFSWMPSLINKNIKIILISDKENFENSLNQITSFGYNIVGYTFYEDLIKENCFSIQEVEYNENTYSDIEKIVKNGEYYVDMREISEYEETGIIENSHLLPLSTLQNDYEKLDKNATIYVFCRSGVRAVIGMSMMKRFGYKNKFIIMKGGINQVISEGYPLVPYKE